MNLHTDIFRFANIYINIDNSKNIYIMKRRNICIQCMGVRCKPVEKNAPRRSFKSAKLNLQPISSAHNLVIPQPISNNL